MGLQSNTNRRAALALLAVLLSAAPFVAAQRYNYYSPNPGTAYTNEFAPRESFLLREQNQRAAAIEQERFRVRIAIPDAVGPELAQEFAARRAAQLNPPPPPSFFSRITSTQLLIAGLVLAAGLVLLRSYAARLLAQNPWAALRTSGTAEQLRTEEATLARFLQTFNTGPVVLPEGPTLSPTTTPTGPNPIKVFHAQAPTLLAELQALIPQINAAEEITRRRDLLHDLARKLHTLKGAAGHPELLPVWQLTGALEGLVQQLTDRAGNFTASTLRTVAGGVDLLPRLCTPGLRPDLLNQPPLRLLAVDDDLISRKAVALALKRALCAPDLAESGPAALTLAELCRYDAIFLDVQMPAMDGFELCGKLHALETNRTTPVIFVTCMDDFEARAKSVAVGGQDLISKPFLTFEITVKALTLIFNHRLPAAAAAPTATVVAPLIAPLERRRPLAPLPEVAEPTPLAPTVEVTKIPAARSRPTKPVSTVPPTSTLPTAPAAEPVWEELPPTPAVTGVAVPPAVIAAHIGINLNTLQEMLAALTPLPAATKQVEALTGIFLLQHALTLNVSTARLPGAYELSAALEALIQKLLLYPEHRTPDTLARIAAALELIAALNAGRLRLPRGQVPAPRLLVVAADLTAGRELVGTLQKVFPKPDLAETAAAALAAAQENKYDVILLPPQMPGGAAAPLAAQLREPPANRATPLLVLLGPEDFVAQAEALRAAGLEVLAKPCLPVELHLQVLVLALRRRAKVVKAGPTAD